MLPTEFDVPKIAHILDEIADKYEESSAEREALDIAVAAVFFLRLPAAYERAQKYIEHLNREPTEKEKACYQIMGYALGEDIPNDMEHN